LTVTLVLIFLTFKSFTGGSKFTQLLHAPERPRVCCYRLECCAVDTNSNHAVIGSIDVHPDRLPTELHAWDR